MCCEPTGNATSPYFCIIFCISHSISTLKPCFAIILIPISPIVRLQTWTIRHCMYRSKKSNVSVNAPAWLRAQYTLTRIPYCHVFRIGSLHCRAGNKIQLQESIHALCCLLQFWFPPHNINCHIAVTGIQWTVIAIATAMAGLFGHVVNITTLTEQAVTIHHVLWILLMFAM